MLSATIHFEPDKVEMTVPIIQMYVTAEKVLLNSQTSPTIQPELWEVVPMSVWVSEDNPGRVTSLHRFEIKVKPGATLPAIRQYLLPNKMRKSLEPLISTFLEQRLQEEMSWSSNTTIMGAKKLGLDKNGNPKYRLVHEL